MAWHYHKHRHFMCIIACNMTLQHCDFYVLLLCVARVLYRWHMWCYCVTWGLENIFDMLVEQNELGFMFRSCPNSISTHMLTMGDPRTFLVWPNQKYSLGCLHGCATLTKFVPNFMRNKSCLVVNSWKCLEHPLIWPTRQIGVLISALSLFG
jgi:hypothetical protein